METTATADPMCRIDKPGHVCRRSDGRRLNGENGDCFAWAESQATTEAVAA